MRETTPNPSRIRLGIAWTLLAGYVAVILAITVSPTPVDRPIKDLIDRLIEKLHNNGVPAFIDYGVVEFTANVAMFVPIGFLAAIAVSRRLWWIVIIVGPLFSFALEQSQSIFLPERFATMNDVIANSVGSLIGAIIGLVLRLMVAYRDELVIGRAMAGVTPAFDP